MELKTFPLSCLTALLLVVNAAAVPSASRALPDAYQPGVAFEVVINVLTDDTVFAWGVEEKAPTGWAVSGVNETGNYDPVGGEVRWFFLDKTARTLKYTLTPPQGATGDVVVSGKVNFGGDDTAIGGDSKLKGAGDPKETPVITWAKPSPITVGTPLGAGQLNATANVAGSFTYNPPSGTVLAVGNGQRLTANFTPTDTTRYTTATKAVTIDVTPPGQSSNANLASLSASAGSLNPAFNSNTTNYSLSVANSVTGTTVTPTVADVRASVRVNGSTVPSGSTSGLLALSVGANPIIVLVTAENGTTKTFTVTVTRANSTDQQSFRIDNYTVDSGGGLIQGGRFKVVSTIAQPDTSTSSAGRFTFEGGFWGGGVQVVQVGGAPQLNIAEEGGLFVLFWSDPDGTSILQQSPDLRSGSWTTSNLAIESVGSMRSTTPFSPGTDLFFRLKVN